MKPKKKPAARKGKGFEWTPQQAAQAESLSGYGLNNPQIAAFFGCSLRTWEKAISITPAIKEAMESGRAKAAAAVTRTAYDLATSGKCPPMTMFWLKTRLGWREVERVEHSGPGGAPIPHAIKVTFVRPRGSGGGNGGD